MGTPTDTARFAVVNQTHLIHRFIHDPHERVILGQAKVRIHADTDTSEELFAAMLPIVRPRISTVEFVREEHHTDEYGVRGAILRDERGYVVVHVDNALIGYNGSGPWLSRRIMALLGYDESVFEMVNDCARPLDQHYDVVVRPF